MHWQYGKSRSDESANGNGNTVEIRLPEALVVKKNFGHLNPFYHGNLPKNLRKFNFTTSELGENDSYTLSNASSTKCRIKLIKWQKEEAFWCFAP